MKTLNIYLVRHGKVDAPPGLHGQTDVKVTPADQESIARAWARVDEVWRNNFFSAFTLSRTGKHHC